MEPFSTPSSLGKHEKKCRKKRSRESEQDASTQGTEPTGGGSHGAGVQSGDVDFGGFDPCFDVPGSIADEAAAGMPPPLFGYALSRIVAVRVRDLASADNCVSGV
jgi:hypothetical protein